MILVFGGAYNGKLNFVKEKYNLNEEDLFFCKDEKLKLSTKAIVGLHIFIKSCILKGINPLKFIEDNLNMLDGKIIVCDEIGSGIVPLKKEDRIWREETGQILQFLSKRSSKVSRIFFGMEEVLKYE
ncbi:bifunctional adenosylcobinamide kinase/adenosylcobinamide-phosphate guanylyltransferase [Clostridium uliginosum]|uniref:Cobinamide kinase / cobinamide phosphate guanyltransferase n=1 Tax=Clostridium uliginosum TaxID=119641 RepID=A0A1I1NXT1_9CLOT|nr:bifunctional adenosylcobinamide kinase/adenosylcobinamide-phosphate guanylyltransferase [Clostridium uliginosum]SFD02484.1 Cobinamide kinase / cobinamide phosphate guanyltransferase [Clostridium uliginosum]